MIEGMFNLVLSEMRLEWLLTRIYLLCDEAFLSYVRFPSPV